MRQLGFEPREDTGLKPAAFASFATSASLVPEEGVEPSKDADP